MVVLTVSGMGCGSCESKIKQAIAQLDPQAKVVVDRPNGVVTVDSQQPAETLLALVQRLGFVAAIAA